MLRMLGLRSQLQVQALNRRVNDSILGSKRAVLLGKLTNASHGGLRQVVGTLGSGSHVSAFAACQFRVSMLDASQALDSGCSGEVALDSRQRRRSPIDIPAL